MTDKKLTALTDAGSLASGDTGDVLYVVNNAGNSRQAKIGSLKTIAAADTGVVIPNVPSDVLAEASDTGVLVKLSDNKFASQWREHNLVVNSHFQVSQENGSAQGTADDYYPADQWRIGFLSGAGAFTIERDAAHPCLTNYPEIPYMVKVDCTTADAARGTSDVLHLSQFIEGIRHVGQLNWGASGGKDLQIGFLCRADYTGTITVSVRNGVPDRSYVVDQAITADTDTWVSVTIPEDTTGTWLETSGIGLRVTVALGAGSDFQGTNETWEGANDIATANTTDFMATLNNTFWLGPMLVFPEDIPMPSDASNLHLFQRPYDRDLTDCQRYFHRDTALGIGNMNFATVACYDGTLWLGDYKYPVPMAAVPTLSFDTATNFAVLNNSAATAASAVSASYIGEKSARLDITTAARTAGDAGVLVRTAGAPYIDFDARL